MDALDARHFDVGGGAGAGDIGGEPRRRGAAGEVFRQRFNDLRSGEDAEVEVR